jgi:naphtho-gamma-pyrone polyketide synthase
MNVSHMIVAKSLIAAGNGPQLFRASAVADWSTKSVGLEIYSVNAVGEKTEEHAKCAVKFESREGWLTDWKRTTYLIKSRMDLLERGTSEGQSDHINRGLAYKLFGAIVEYGMCYQGMQHVILNSGQLEATALVKFQTTEKEENHFISPYWIDSLGSIAGFIMNANDTTNSKTQVFINRGWDSMRCSTRFSREKTYRTYNKMQNVEGSLFVGDTYVFDEEEIVAVFGGVKVRSLIPMLLCSH